MAGAYFLIERNFVNTYMNKLQRNPRLAVDWTMDKSKTKKQVNTNKTHTNTWKTQVGSGLGDG